MKKLPLTLLVLLSVSKIVAGQMATDNKDNIVNNSRPGLMNITELNIGIGLYAVNRDYAKRIVNLTSIWGIGLTRNLTGGIGIGVSLYNGGTLVPLFADFRYFFNLGKTRFFAFGDGGILLNSSKTEGGTKILASPGAGVVLPVSNSLSVNLGAGLFVQFRQDYPHDSFANIKLGMTYSFKNKTN